MVRRRNIVKTKEGKLAFAISLSIPNRNALRPRYLTSEVSMHLSSRVKGPLVFKSIKKRNVNEADRGPRSA